MRRLVVGVDICNTIADVNSKIEEILGPCPRKEEYVHPGATEEFFQNHPEVFSEALPYPNSARELTMLAHAGADIFYITARPEWAKNMTERWLVRFGFPVGEIICTTRKDVVVQRLGVEIVIEDAPHEIVSLQRHTNAVIWRKRQPYNEWLNVPPVGW